eukprot:5747576-Pleurochrysis_carterae.AAC.2
METYLPWITTSINPSAPSAAGWRAESGSQATDTEVLCFFIFLAAQVQEALLDEWLQTAPLEEHVYKASRANKDAQHVRALPLFSCACAQTTDCWTAT